MYKKILLFNLIIFLFFFLLIELFLGNRDFRRKHPGQLSAAWYKINKKIIYPVTLLLNKHQTFEDRDTDINPWISYPTSPGIRLHPFWDYSRVVTKHNLEKLDYFGFRNDTDLYFNSERDYVLIVITGGSEAAGYTHEKSIAQNLEIILNSKVKNTKFRVLNLSMNSYTLPNEINAYIHLAYALQPEYVITHSGSNDVSSSIQMPKNFKKLGLYYKKDVEKDWLPRFYDSTNMTYLPNKDPKKSLVDRNRFLARKKFLIYEKGLDLVAPSYIKSVKKYKKIVESNGGNFIVGIQPVKHSIELEKPLWLIQENNEEVINVLKSIYSDLEQEARENKFLVFSDIDKFDFVDFVHTSDSSSLKIAQIYSKIILGNFD